MWCAGRTTRTGRGAKSRRQRAVPLDFLTVQAFDTYEFERMRVPAAAGSDFVFVNLSRAPLGAPMRLDAVNDLIAAAARRAGLDPPVRPHQLRHAFASQRRWTPGGTLEEVQDLLGHASISSTQVYAHPDPARLRAAVDAVPSPRVQTGGQGMSGAAAGAGRCPRPAGRARCSTRVLAGVALHGAAARLAAVLDPAFLAGAGWDPRSRVLSLPAGHRMLGRGVCRVGGCAATAHPSAAGSAAAALPG